MRWLTLTHLWALLIHGNRAQSLIRSLQLALYRDTDYSSCRHTDATWCTTRRERIDSSSEGQLHSEAFRIRSTSCRQFTKVMTPVKLNSVDTARRNISELNLFTWMNSAVGYNATKNLSRASDCTSTWR